MSKEELLSTGDVAKCLGVTTQQVRYLVKVGQIEPTAEHERGRFFREADVERLANEQRQKSWRDKRVRTPNTSGLPDAIKESWRDKARRDGVEVPPEIADQLDKLEVSKAKHEYGYEHPSGLFRIEGRRERSERNAYLRDESTRLKERRAQVRKLIATAETETLDELLNEMESLALALHKIGQEQAARDPRQPDTSPPDHDPRIYADLIAFFMAEGASFEQAQAALIRDAKDEVAEIAIRKVTPGLAEGYLRRRLGKTDTMSGHHTPEVWAVSVVLHMKHYDVPFEQALRDLLEDADTDEARAAIRAVTPTMVEQAIEQGGL